MRVLLAACLALCAVNAAAAWLEDSRAIMGTEVRVSLWHDDPAAGREALEAAFAKMVWVDETLSPYKPTSALSRVNAKAAAGPVPVSPELALLVRRAGQFSELSGGAFDITFASLGRHYDYRAGRAPSEQLTRELLPAIDYRWLALDENAGTLAFRHPDVQIDLGGIAKGWAVDLAVAELVRHGVKSAAVSAGGDSRVLGTRQGEPWRVGIKNPRISERDGRATVITLPLADTAVSTSGDYERFFLAGDSGQRVHHILNPKTGRSAEGVMSVTIIGPEGLSTDALSTTVFILGPRRGLELIDRLPGYDAVVIDDQGGVHYSAGLAPPPAGGAKQ